MPRISATDSAMDSATDRTTRNTQPRSELPAHAEQPKTWAGAESAPERRAALVAFLRALAIRVEQDPAFARTLLAVYAESSQAQPAPPPRSPATPTTVPPLDPFALLREQDEVALHSRLVELDLAALRTILRTHRLDPARIASRWTSRERIADLIVEQVRARTRQGRAFERV